MDLLKDKALVWQLTLVVNIDTPETDYRERITTAEARVASIARAEVLAAVESETPLGDL